MQDEHFPYDYRSDPAAEARSRALECIKRVDEQLADNRREELRQWERPEPSPAPRRPAQTPRPQPTRDAVLDRETQRAWNVWLDRRLDKRIDGLERGVAKFVAEQRREADAALDALRAEVSSLRIQLQELRAERPTAEVKYLEPRRTTMGRRRGVA